MGIFEGKIRQVGGSFGILVPKEIIEAEGIEMNETVKVAILKKDNSLLERAFGSVKTKPFKREHRDRGF